MREKQFSDHQHGIIISADDADHRKELEVFGFQVRVHSGPRKAPIIREINIPEPLKAPIPGDYDYSVEITSIRPLTRDDLDFLSAPPGLAEAVVVLFGPKRRVDAILGDLTERFNEELAQKGLKRARLLFWARVLRSIGPLLWAKIRKAGVFVTICEIGRRFIGS
jgi:hypothetical protein